MKATGQSSASENEILEAPERRNVCSCFQVTYEDLQKMLDATNGAHFEVLKKYYYVGSRCTSCQYEIKDLVTIYRDERKLGHVNVGNAPPWRQRLEGSYRAARNALRRRLTLRRFGIFILRNADGESSLALSNLKFPEDGGNANGEKVGFDLTLFDQAGEVVARRSGLGLASNASMEILISDLFPALPDRFFGMLFIDYKTLNQVGSLRPYCCFNFDKGETGYRGRWHYHDKYSLNDYNGHYHNNHPLFPGQECWMALSNPRPTTYKGTVHLRVSDGRAWNREVVLPPHGSSWARVRDLFPEAPDTDPNALLWFDDNKRLMVWFFWHKVAGNIWIVQHH